MSEKNKKLFSFKNRTKNSLTCYNATTQSSSLFNLDFH